MAILNLRLIAFLGFATAMGIAASCSGRRLGFPTVESLRQVGLLDASTAGTDTVGISTRGASTDSVRELIAQLERGRALASVECSDCHRQYWPAEHPTSEWPMIIRDMGDRASLASQEITDVETYFHFASRWAHLPSPNNENP